MNCVSCNSQLPQYRFFRCQCKNCGMTYVAQKRSLISVYQGLRTLLWIGVIVGSLYAGPVEFMVPAVLIVMLVVEVLLSLRAQVWVPISLRQRH